MFTKKQTLSLADMVRQEFNEQAPIANVASIVWKMQGKILITDREFAGISNPGFVLGVNSVEDGEGQFSVAKMLGLAVGRFGLLEGLKPDDNYTFTDAESFAYELLMPADEFMACVKESTEERRGVAYCNTAEVALRFNSTTDIVAKRMLQLGCTRTLVLEVRPPRPKITAETADKTVINTDVTNHEHTLPEIGEETQNNTGNPETLNNEEENNERIIKETPNTLNDMGENKELAVKNVRKRNGRRNSGTVKSDSGGN